MQETGPIKNPWEVNLSYTCVSIYGSWKTGGWASSDVSLMFAQITWGKCWMLCSKCRQYDKMSSKEKDGEATHEEYLG